MIDNEKQSEFKVESPSLPVQQHELEHVIKLKHPDPQGWGVVRRNRFGYVTPDDVYETILSKFVTPETNWLDVGGGRDVFPGNPRLEQLLARRCRQLAAVDPSDNLDENTLADVKFKCGLEDLQCERVFQLATLRMVAEHLVNPDAAVASLARVIVENGVVIVYTVNKWSPVSIASAIIPFQWHHAIKKRLWRTNECDSFPVVYKMNAHRSLTGIFERHGFKEKYFSYLDDLRTLANFRIPNYLELTTWSILKKLGLQYPENCLLGVYERVSG